MKELKRGDETEWGIVIDIEKRGDGLHYVCEDVNTASISTIPEQLFDLKEKEK